VKKPWKDSMVRSRPTDPEQARETVLDLVNQVR